MRVIKQLWTRFVELVRSWPVDEALQTRGRRMELFEEQMRWRDIEDELR